MDCISSSVYSGDIRLGVLYSLLLLTNPVVFTIA